MRFKVVDRYVKELSPKLEAEYIKNRKELKYTKKTNLEVLHETSDDLANKVYNDSMVIILASTFSAIFFLVLMAIVQNTASLIVGMSSFALAFFILGLHNTIANHVVQRLVEVGIEKNLTKLSLIEIVRNESSKEKATYLK